MQVRVSTNTDTRPPLLPDALRGRFRTTCRVSIDPSTTDQTAGQIAACRLQQTRRPRSEMTSKAYSSRAIRAHLRRRRIVAVIPEPADQQGHRKRRGTRGGRPPAFDRVDYRGRNVVERGFCEVKQWRGLATRYDKLALTFRGGVALKAIVTWLRTLGDTP
ncbi:transposase [Pseudonocardia sp. ICBG1293]|uniref:transposase n=1 Tax=Pseudonocardia sp. ICBG1293 TaxID=2844382 RepID=UPI0035A8CF47